MIENALRLGVTVWSANVPIGVPEAVASARPAGYNWLMAKSKQRATYDDLDKLPAHLVGEIIDGELIASPRPDPAHAHAATASGGRSVAHPVVRAVGGFYSNPSCTSKATCWSRT